MHGGCAPDLVAGLHGSQQFRTFHGVEARVYALWYYHKLRFLQVVDPDGISLGELGDTDDSVGAPQEAGHHQAEVPPVQREVGLRASEESQVVEGKYGPDLVQVRQEMLGGVKDVGVAQDRIQGDVGI
jgi:hypothetical protein